MVIRKIKVFTNMIYLKSEVLRPVADVFIYEGYDIIVFWLKLESAILFLNN